MMSRPLLSLCIPTYNRAAILARTLEAIAPEVSDDTEIVVSDNCSSDATPEVIARFSARFPHFRTARQPATLKAIENVAASMLLARGRYSYTLSDDDRPYMASLRAAVSVMEADREVVGVYGGYQEWIPESDQIVGTYVATDARIDFTTADRRRLFDQFVMIWYPVYRTEIAQRFHVYDGRCFGHWPLAGALLEHGKLAVIPEIFYRHAHTHPRLEYELTEAWYQDSSRSQFEVYLGRDGPSNDTEVAALVQRRMAPGYMPGRIA